jgi:hypothetical protein
MMAVARDLDHLEKHIDWYGSATAKAPDVWGQARLTQYREEFEKEMAPAAKDFEAVISGTQSRSDQSFLASATALSFAIQPKPPVIGNVTSTKTAAAPSTPALVPTSSNLQQFKLDPQSGSFSILDTVSAKPASPAAPPASPPPTPIAPLPLATTDSLLAVGSGAIKQNAPTAPATLVFAAAKNGIGLEKTEYLNQKARYLNHLAQIRRNNEGDDTADSPGYSLNLIRIPVSVLPGKKTDTGHGAEVTMTIQPMLGEELLPATFRNLVIAGLTKELGYPLTKFLDEDDQIDLSKNINRLLVRHLLKLDDIIKAAGEGIEKYEEKLASLPKELADLLALNPEDRKSYVMIDKGMQKLGKDLKPTLRSLQGKPLKDYWEKFVPDESQKNQKCNPLEESIEQNELASTNEVQKQARIQLIGEYAKQSGVIDKVVKLKNNVVSLGVPFSSGTRNRQSIPISQYLEVYGGEFPYEVAYQANIALKSTIETQGYAHLPDVQGFLQHELDAAYRMLMMPESDLFWQMYCNAETVKLVRNRNARTLQEKRVEFRQKFQAISNSQLAQIDLPNEQSEFSSTAALAWMILVHSALLNERLILDMKETSASKQTVLPSAGDWPDFYLPCPSQQARTAFNAYVNMRWPVKVFAVDPTNDEQNIADSLSTRREMQLALSVAFTNGSINGNQFNKYARRLEAEYQTLDLNRTQIGFGHGENVFGWRFYPRFQTPDTKGNLSVAFRDQLIGGPSKDELLRQRKLEPGIRECTALVIMPSFVPHVRLDVTTNWFSLTNPKHKVLDHTQALKLSQRVKSISMKGPSVKDAECYREGDQLRLINRAEQLAARLPMQTLTSQVPVDGNLGGFELFVHGTTDFAPELYGWYGAPGIDQAKDKVTLFLVGNHFSVTQSKVLIGNAELTPNDVKMISRQVMQVTVPKSAISYQYEGDDFSVMTTEVKKGKNSSKTIVTTGLNGTRTESSITEVTADKDNVVTTTTTNSTNGMESPQKKFYINVHVATPYGVTRELAVPVINMPKPEVKPAEVKPTESPKPDSTFSYAKSPVGEGKYAISVKKAEPNSGITLKDKLDTSVPKLDLRFDLSIDGCAMTIVLKGAAMGNYKTDNDLYKLDDTLMDSIRDQLNRRVVGNAGILFQDVTNPFRAGDFEVKATVIVNGKSFEAAKPLLWRFTCMVP